MAQKITTFSMGNTSDICMLKESKLKIKSECTDEKCQLAFAMLKPGYQYKKHLPFLDLVDHNLLMILSIPELKGKIENSLFTQEEQSFLLEARRKYKNRKSANKSRMQHDVEIDRLEKELYHLEEIRDSQKREKQALRNEIQFYSVRLSMPTF